MPPGGEPMTAERRLALAEPWGLRRLGSSPYVDVHAERTRAHAKFADAPGGSMEMRRWDDPDWLSVLVEEVGEVARELCEHRHRNTTRDEYRARLRAELVQVAAMACAWITSIDADQLGWEAAVDTSGADT